MRNVVRGLFYLLLKSVIIFFGHVLDIFTKYSSTARNEEENKEGSVVECHLQSGTHVINTNKWKQTTEIHT